ncbi:hypothetical protein [Streptomyces synnematoformans]|uniref:Uncharacterized protein n=1 Tax=Streptomyces synnematoformans TaxID=415721 RepID=A0ABN2XF07_9ACTN
MTTDTQAMKKAATWLHTNSDTLAEMLRFYSERMGENADTLEDLAARGGNALITASAAAALAADFEQRQQHTMRLQTELYELHHGE